MSDSSVKKLKREVRKHVQIQTRDIALSLQELVLKFTLRKRLSIAWKIIKGKAFLEGIGKLENKST